MLDHFPIPTVEPDTVFVKTKNYVLDFETSKKELEFSAKLYQKGLLFADNYGIGAVTKTIDVSEFVVAPGNSAISASMWFVFAIVPALAILSLFLPRRKKQ